MSDAPLAEALAELQNIINSDDPSAARAAELATSIELVTADDLAELDDAAKLDLIRGRLQPRPVVEGGNAEEAAAAAAAAAEAAAAAAAAEAAEAAAAAEAQAGHLATLKAELAEKGDAINISRLRSLAQKAGVISEAEAKETKGRDPMLALVRGKLGIEPDQAAEAPAAPPPPGEAVRAPRTGSQAGFVHSNMETARGILVRYMRSQLPDVRWLAWMAIDAGMMSDAEAEIERSRPDQLAFIRARLAGREPPPDLLPAEAEEKPAIPQQVFMHPIPENERKPGLVYEDGATRARTPNQQPVSHARKPGEGEPDPLTAPSIPRVAVAVPDFPGRVRRPESELETPNRDRRSVPRVAIARPPTGAVRTPQPVAAAPVAAGPSPAPSAAAARAPGDGIGSQLDRANTAIVNAQKEALKLPEDDPRRAELLEKSAAARSALGALFSDFPVQPSASA